MTVWNYDVEQTPGATVGSGKSTWSYSFANGLAKGGCTP